MSNANWPSVSILCPVLNGGELLKKLCDSIKNQDYPGKVEVIVADGASTDDTVQTAKSFGFTVVPNPQVLAEPGAVLARSHATGDILVYAAADNGFPRPDWLRMVVQPFLDRPQVVGVYTQIIPAMGDNSFTEYYCRLHVEPFTWFVYGDACSPRDFHKAYSVKYETEHFVVYDFTPMQHPLLAIAQGFAVRSTFKRRRQYENDDILPVIQMLEEGQELAYVPAAGVYHHHLNSFSHYIRKYRWRIRNSFTTTDAGFDNRAKFLSPKRRSRKYLFAIYGVTVVGPLLDSLILCWKEKRWCMLWHGPASIALSWLALTEFGRSKIARLRA